ncbi:phBC6A51 family helix-turn-helix protein [Bacillus sp. es.036]|uniref:phBC6A51 family helix-turn-helix protein n=1 Tax=Bacillus sp. es.036 TaxID=1761764 RepID=UPI000BF961E7|nr:phBC6A51 family helix-turn-helix protein [Bacillus sp. es.036]PFG03031.1 putative insertion element HTH domain-containing protein [Bacillus sp. es.036]
MKKDARLDTRQIRILEDYFGRSVAGETKEKIAESHGISRKTLYMWESTDHGKQLHADFQKEMSTNDLPKFYQKLSEKMQSGSYKHMELYAKIHGLLAPEKKEVTSHNVNEETSGAHKPTSKEYLAELEALLEEPTIKRVK